MWTRKNSLYSTPSKRIHRSDELYLKTIAEIKQVQKEKSSYTNNLSEEDKKRITRAIKAQNPLSNPKFNNNNKRNRPLSFGNNMEPPNKQLKSNTGSTILINRNKKVNNRLSLEKYLNTGKNNETQTLNELSSTELLRKSRNNSNIPLFNNIKQSQRKSRKLPRSTTRNISTRINNEVIDLNDNINIQNLTQSDLLDEGDVYNLTITSKINSSYKVTSEVLYKGKHPAHIIETKTLASVKLPKLNISIHLPPGCFPDNEASKQCKYFKPCLSALQVETIYYACQKHEEYLIDNTRAGYFIADGTGVGKGREVSGIIYDNFIKGRKKSIWFTASNALLYDSQRDITDIGCKDIIPVLTLPSKSQIPINSNYGVLFCTYSMLIRKDRYTQILNWLISNTHSQNTTYEDLCKEFTGLIVFDEGHSAKNFDSQKIDNSSKTALAVIELQNLLPNARILYVSATPATEPNHMGYMMRLGLWGKHLIFPNFTTFSNRIQQSGISAMELVAIEMKTKGCYCSRHLSYKGTRFDVVEFHPKHKQELLYDNSVKLWNDLIIPWYLKNVNIIDNKRAFYAKLWSAHQRYFLQLIFAIKVIKCKEIVEKALNEDKCAVIGLFSTGEAKLKERAQDNIFFNSIISTTKEIIYSLLTTFPDPPKSIYTAMGHIDFPPSPLDHLIDILGGVDKVAEMSGRSSRLVQYGDNKYMIESRNSKQENFLERDAFMNGDKNIAIITAAASVGISLQAAKTCNNKKQRIHIILELPWSADKAIQQIGRTHRSNQETYPHYKMIITSLGGEWRLASTVANRLSSLGALTTGERKSGVASASLSSFEISEDFSKEAIRLLASKSLLHCSNRCRSDTKLLKLYNSDDYKYFLNRLLGLCIDDQEIIFSMFVECYQQVINNAKLCGKIDNEIFDLKGKLLELPKYITNTENEQVLQIKILIDRGIVWDKIEQIYKDFCINISISDNPNPLNGFYIDDNSNNNIIFAGGLSETSYHIIYPHLGHQRISISKDKLLSKYTAIKNLDKVKILWNKCYKENKALGKKKRLTQKILLVGPLFAVFKVFNKLIVNSKMQCVRAQINIKKYGFNKLKEYPILNNFEEYMKDNIKIVGVLLPSDCNMNL